MKKNNINIDLLFESARFDVADDGFTKRIMSNLPFGVVIDKRKIWKDVFSKVSAVVAVCAMICLFVCAKIDFSKIGQGFYGSINKIEQRVNIFESSVVEENNDVPQ